MTKTALLLTLLVAALVCALNAIPAQAQPIRVFVALTGNDSNPCTFASPCKSVQHAHDVVAAAGEVRMLDPGSYGLLTITKSISILGDGHGGIAAQSGSTAITINAGASDKINLRGLVIEGFSTGASGIVFNGGASLNIQNCLIRNFFNIGIAFRPAASIQSQFHVSDTVVSDNNGPGILIQPINASAVKVGVALIRVQTENNQYGVRVDTSGVTSMGTSFSTMTDVTISDSTIAGNSTGVGASATNTSGFALLFIKNSLIIHNGTGFAYTGNSAIELTHSNLTNNDVGWSGTLNTTGDNVIQNANDNVLPVLPFALR